MNKLLPLIGLQLLAATLVVLNALLPGAPLPPALYFNPPYVYAAFNSIFLLPAGLGIAYISSKAFRSSGLFGIQMMGVGALALCLSTLSTWVGVSDQAIAIYYAVLELFGIFFGSVLQALGVLFIFKGTTIEPQRRGDLLLWTYTAVALLALVTLAGSVAGFIPPFFASSTQTLTSRVVLSSAAVFIVFSAVLLGWTYLSSPSEILYWYTVAMLLILMSVASYIFIRHPGDAISWLYRGTTFLYAGAFLTAVLKSRVSHRKAEEGISGEAASISANY